MAPCTRRARNPIPLMATQVVDPSKTYHIDDAKGTWGEGMVTVSIGALASNEAKAPQGVDPGQPHGSPPGRAVVAPSSAAGAAASTTPGYQHPEGESPEIQAIAPERPTQAGLPEASTNCQGQRPNPAMNRKPTNPADESRPGPATYVRPRARSNPSGIPHKERLQQVQGFRSWQSII